MGVPIGYHGRASSIVPSGTAFHRPNGQTKAPDQTAPTLGPSRRLDEVHPVPPLLPGVPVYGP